MKTEMEKLIETLNEASEAYYLNDNPIMSDKEYDDLIEKLKSMERETGVTLSNSPLNKVQGNVAEGFKKVKHSKPMLSAAKTKSQTEIEKFVRDKDYYASFKLDGCTLVVKYQDGLFKQGITRGNGTIGEDVTEACRYIKNLPMQISYKGDLELRGECVISWEEFHRINKTLVKPYLHPRNLAAGTLRNLNTDIVKERNLACVIFECVTESFGTDNKYNNLNNIEDLGFEIVKRTELNPSVIVALDNLLPESYLYPVDGLVFELNSNKLSKSLGATSHHECCRMALKWKDELHTTVLRQIKWNTTKTGLINPIAVFDPVDLEGALTSKATLHNISYIKKLQLGIGDKIEVYRSNMVIPRVHNNLTRSNTFRIPTECPCCGAETVIVNNNESEFLKCKGENCKAKLLGKLTHFVSKNAINIEGLSEQTLEKLIELDWVKSFKDIYRLDYLRLDLKELEGFGDKSVDKLLDNIEKSRKTDLSRVLYAQSIPLIGKSASKDIASYCHHNIQTFINFMNVYYDFTVIDGFGSEMQKSLSNWWKDNEDEFVNLIKEFTFEKVEEKSNGVGLSGKVFVVTGSLNHYKNRNELVNVIESLGAKVSGSVSAKTSYLINNDVTSTSGKNKKAKDLNIPIISEEDFLKMIDTKKN